jgi:hypothetical protein
MGKRQALRGVSSRPEGLNNETGAPSLGGRTQASATGILTSHEKTEQGKAVRGINPGRMLGQTMSNKRSHSDPIRSPSSRLLVLLFVGAFLLCHGVFGALHLFSDPPVSYVNHAEAIPMPTLTGEVAQEQSMDDKMGENYFAVLLLVAFLGLLLLGTRLWGTATVFRASGRRFSPFVVHLPRGSPAPLLQVFRL